jgi:hypothetical protein
MSLIGCFCRYNNPSQVASEIPDASDYRRFRGLDKLAFAFMPAGEALQVCCRRAPYLQAPFLMKYCVITRFETQLYEDLMYKTLVTHGCIKFDQADEVTWPWPLHLQLQTTQMPSEQVVL